MSTKKVVLISSIFIAVLSVFRLIWLFFCTTPDHPVAIQGELDLRHWEPIAEHTIRLDGEWEFYPETFLTEQKNTSNRTFVEVPQKNVNYEYGSYRLKVLVNPDQDETYGLNVKNIPTSSEIYINGQLLSQSGQPATDKQSYEPAITPQSLLFTLEDTDEIEIIIQFANFDDPLDNGITHSISFGLLQPFIQHENFTTNIVILACLVYFIHAIYSVVIYFVGQRDNRFIYFALMILSGVIFSTLIGEELFFTWIPFSFEWGVKFNYFTKIAGGFFLLLSIKSILPKFIQTKLVKPYIAICIISTLSILLLPAKYIYTFKFLYLLIILLPCLATLYILFRATAKKINKHNIFLLLAAIAAFGSLFWFIIIQIMNINVISYPFDLMIALVCFSAYWFKQYFQILNHSHEMMTKLQQSDQAKEEFLISVAHEIKNPLHSMINIAQAVLEKEKRSIQTESVKNLNLMTTVGRHLSTIVNELLDLARLRENKISIQPNNVSIYTITEAVIDMIQYLTDLKAVQLINEIPRDFPLVYADKTRITQVIFNLLNNAVTHAHASEIKVSATIRDNVAVISVSDNGIGIEEDFLDKIFKPYEQASNDTLVNNGGFGLGLTVCNQLIKLHNSTLQIDTKRNEGTTFTFTLPLVDTTVKLEHTENQRNINEDEVEATKEYNTKNTDNKKTLSNPIRILAVDDNPTNLKVLQSLFTSSNEQISIVTNGQEALSLIKNASWDLLIVDVMMPKMSGYELTRLVRQQYSLSELPILLITARNSPEDIVAGFMAGANDYVTKPIERLELKARIQNLTNLKQSIGEQLRTEAAWLHAQIQPHFIFNTINTIASLSEIDTERMTNLLMEFGNYLRKSFNPNSSKRLVPLEHELELLNSYLYIQTERFGERLNIIWDVDESIQIEIPPLTIQPLVENAIRHGILKRLDGGTVRIQIKKANEQIKVTIEDDGVGMDEDKIKQVLSSKPKETQGVGLYNTNRRLIQTYGQGLQIKSRLNVGTTVSFTIPNKTSDSFD